MLSWYPPGVADDHGEPTEDMVPAVLDAAHRHSIKVTGETTGMFFTLLMILVNVVLSVYNKRQAFITVLYCDKLCNVSFQNRVTMKISFTVHNKNDHIAMSAKRISDSF